MGVLARGSIVQQHRCGLAHLGQSLGAGHRAKHQPYERSAAELELRTGPCRAPGHSLGHYPARERRRGHRRPARRGDTQLEPRWDDDRLYLDGLDLLRPSRARSTRKLLHDGADRRRHLHGPVQRWQWRYGNPVANDQGAAQYYPSFSPDDKYIAYNRVAKLDANAIYYRPDAELYIIPSGGGTKVRLAANDPPACTGLTTATIHNSWPEWAPNPKPANGVTYYFMTF